MLAYKVHKQDLASVKTKVVKKLRHPRPTFNYDRLHINSLSHFSEPTPKATTNKELGSYSSLIDSNLL